MNLESPFRAARIEDCHNIAELFSIASDGVANYVWSTLMPQYPGLTLLEIGSKRYASEEGNFSYKNCIIAEHNREAIGMMLTFPIEESEADSTSEPPDTSDEPDVLAPYNLEAPNTWYICAIALFPEFRGRGMGTQFLAIAREQAKEKGYSALSLLCFEQNTRAFKLYERNGFKVCDRAPVVPHELIHYTGDILLMTAPV